MATKEAAGERWTWSAWLRCSGVRAVVVVLTPALILIVGGVVSSSIPRSVYRLAPWCIVSVLGYPHDFDLPPRQRSACDVDPKGLPTAAKPTPSDASAQKPPTPVRQGVEPTSGSASTTASHAPKTYLQLRARQSDLVFGFVLASTIVRIVSTIVLVASFAYVVRASSRGFQRGRVPPLLMGAVCVTAGGMIGWRLSYGVPMSNALLMEPLKAASAFYGFSDDVRYLQGAGLVNLILGFMAAGAVLAMFAEIAQSGDDARSRLGALQLALLMGAGLFTSDSYANAQLAEWAKGLLDPVLMSNAGDVIDHLPALSALLSSSFLVVAVGTTYLFVRGQTRASSGGGGSLLDLRTADGEDFKFFGWLVNFLLLLSPVWGALKFPSIQPFQ